MLNLFLIDKIILFFEVLFILVKIMLVGLVILLNVLVWFILFWLVVVLSISKYLCGVFFWNLLIIEYIFLSLFIKLILFCNLLVVLINNKL